jgi:hypothetical protein
MNTIATTVAPESREAALMRLADKARATSIRLYQDRVDGRFYASSRSHPGALHRLTGFSCTCQGFIRRGRCAHLAALHSALGWLDGPDDGGAALPNCSTCMDAGHVDAPRARWIGSSKLGFRDDPEPEPPVCSACQGAGVVQQPRSRWIGGSRTGFRDTWSVSIVCPACTPAVAA